MNKNYRKYIIGDFLRPCLCPAKCKASWQVSMNYQIRKDNLRLKAVSWKISDKYFLIQVLDKKEERFVRQSMLAVVRQMLADNNLFIIDAGSKQNEVAKFVKFNGEL